jgi:hypothetical protein
VRCHETEEIFFILDGKVRVRCWENGENCGITLGRWDLVAPPPFLPYELFKREGHNICHLQTLLAKPQPVRPQYRPRAFEAAGAYPKSTTRIPSPTGHRKASPFATVREPQKQRRAHCRTPCIGANVA